MRLQEGQDFRMDLELLEGDLPIAWKLVEGPGR